MALKRIEPLTNKHDLGYVLLWQDELAQVIRLMRQLDASSLHIEADGYTLTDIAVDLPGLKTKRVKSFKASVTRPSEDGEDDSTLSIELSKNVARMEDTNADLLTMGALNSILSLMKQRERMPRGEVGKLFRGGAGMGLIWTSILAIVVVVFIYFVLLAFTGIGLYGLIGKGSGVLPPAGVFSFALIAIVLGGVWLYSSNQVKAAMYTGTRAEAPTWWQEHRSDIGINAAFSVVFLILGAVIGHYWH